MKLFGFKKEMYLILMILCAGWYSAPWMMSKDKEVPEITAPSITSIYSVGDTLPPGFIIVTDGKYFTFKDEDDYQGVFVKEIHKEAVEAAWEFYNATKTREWVPVK